MMERRPPWIVENVDPEAQEAAKLCARRAGLDLGAWLNRTILHAATRELKHNGRGLPDEDAGGGGHRNVPALTAEVLVENIQRLAQRLESAELRTAESIRPLAEKVSELTRRVEEVSVKPEVSTAPMERALSRMAERLERLESQKGEKPAGRRSFFSLR